MLIVTLIATVVCLPSAQTQETAPAPNPTPNLPPRSGAIPSAADLPLPEVLPGAVIELLSQIRIPAGEQQPRYQGGKVVAGDGDPELPSCTIQLGTATNFTRVLPTGRKLVLSREPEIVEREEAPKGVGPPPMRYETELLTLDDASVESVVCAAPAHPPTTKDLREAFGGQVELLLPPEQGA